MALDQATRVAAITSLQEHLKDIKVITSIGAGYDQGVPAITVSITEEVKPGKIPEFWMGLPVHVYIVNPESDMM